MKTCLKDRTLWYDGTVQVEPERVPELLLNGAPIEKIIVTHHNDDTALFNSLDGPTIKDSKLENDVLDMSWQIPENYFKIDLRAYLILLLINKINPSNAMHEKYAQRLAKELDQIESRNMTKLIQTLIFVVHKLTETQTVWGVGRGSSCASLVLHLIGVHEVDPIRFGIPMEEFFHD